MYMVVSGSEWAVMGLMMMGCKSARAYIKQTNNRKPNQTKTKLGKKNKTTQTETNMENIWIKSIHMKFEQIILVNNYPDEPEGH